MNVLILNVIFAAIFIILVVIIAALIYLIVNENLKRFRLGLKPGQKVWFHGLEWQKCKIVEIVSVSEKNYTEYHLESEFGRMIYTTDDLIFPKKYTKLFVSFL